MDRKKGNDKRYYETMGGGSGGDKTILITSDLSHYNYIMKC